MSSKLNPYLQFPGTTREAMAFYQQVFGGTLVMNTFGEYGMADPQLADKIMHAMLETPAGYTLMASDPAPGMPEPAAGTFAVSLSGDDGEDLRGYFAALSDGGAVMVPLEKQMWGDEFGFCSDRFGVTWMVNIAAAQG